MPPLILDFVCDWVLDQLEVPDVSDLAQLSCLAVAQILVMTGLWCRHDIAPGPCHIFRDETSQAFKPHCQGKQRPWGVDLLRRLLCGDVGSISESGGKGRHARVTLHLAEATLVGGVGRLRFVRVGKASLIGLTFDHVTFYLRLEILFLSQPGRYFLLK